MGKKVIAVVCAYNAAATIERFGRVSPPES